jgi:8-oxo-dGTP pyrophosphatase MutT (NUDIX family)
MEPGEEITEAAIREVKEETGLDFEPSTLLSVEAAGTRFLLDYTFQDHIVIQYNNEIFTALINA